MAKIQHYVLFPNHDNSMRLYKELKAIGVNCDFAPSFDVNNNPSNPAINTRSFGEDKEKVSKYGTALMQGMKDAGVAGSAKHFPGHGDTDVDSHGALPVINIDEETLFSRELVPFISLIESGVPAIMTGHISFPKIVPNGEPASLSKTFVLYYSYWPAIWYHLLD